MAEKPDTSVTRRIGWKHPAMVLGVVALAVVGLALYLALSRPPAPAPTDDPVADSGGPATPDSGDRAEAPTGTLFSPRPTSSRRLLRMGTTRLDSAVAPEVASASQWGLLHVEANGDVVPVLVPARPTVENGLARPTEAGGFEVTWRLRQGLRWSDGHPLEAHDFVFALEVSPERWSAEMAAPRSRTLVVTWSEQEAAALESLRPLPRHVLAELFAAGGVAAVAEHLRSQPTPSLGPYHVVEFTPDELLVLEANPHFLGEPPAIPRIEVVRRSPDELIRSFESGNLDLILPDAISVEQAVELSVRRRTAVHVRTSNSQVALQPDMSHPLLRRLQARRALIAAIDRVALAQEVFGERGEVSHTPQRSPLPASVERFEHQPAEAREVLARLATGDEERALVVSHEAADWSRRAAVLVARDLEAAGLEVTLSELSPQEHLDRRRRGRHGGLLLTLFRSSRNPDVLSHMNVPHDGVTYDLSARHSGFDDRMAAMVSRERRALDPAQRGLERESLWSQYSRRLPLLPLVFTTERLVVQPELRGWEQPEKARFGAGIEGWYFSTGGADGGASGPVGAEGTTP